MPTTPDELVVKLSQQRYLCPICKTNDWGVPESLVQLQTNDEIGNSLSVLRAICFTCGFLASFQQGVPENARQMP